MNLVASLPLSHLTDFRFEMIQNNNFGIYTYIYMCVVICDSIDSSIHMNRLFIHCHKVVDPNHLLIRVGVLSRHPSDIPGLPHSECIPPVRCQKHSYRPDTGRKRLLTSKAAPNPDHKDLGEKTCKHLQTQMLL